MFQREVGVQKLAGTDIHRHFDGIFSDSPPWFKGAFQRRFKLNGCNKSFESDEVNSIQGSALTDIYIFCVLEKQTMQNPNSCRPQ
jgi:hypothetical protein